MKKTIAAVVTVASVAESLTTTPAHAQRGGPYYPYYYGPSQALAARSASGGTKAGGRYAAGLLLQLPAPGVRFHCRFLMQSEGEALAGFGFPEQESRAERGRLRCHKRPKSREETPKEGSDSASEGQGVATAYPI